MAVCGDGHKNADDHDDYEIWGNRHDDDEIQRETI